MLKVASVIATTALFSSLSYGKGAMKPSIEISPTIIIAPTTINPCPSPDPR